MNVFHQYTPDDVRDLVAGFPLAWVTARAGGEAAQLPLLGEYDAEGNLVALLGHMARRNPLHAALADAPEATILFTGPQGYVSTTQAERRNWAPTWNYAQAVVSCAVEIVPDETEAAVLALTEATEGDRWTHHELGPRYDGMIRAVVAFRARVLSVAGRFKLGQDEAPEVFEAICRNHPDKVLVEWMRRFRER